MHITYRGYFAWFGASLAASLLAIAGFIAVIDPYDLTDLISLRHVNAEKTQRFDGGGRVEHSIRLWRNRYQTLILGSSRCQVGIDPTSPLLLPGRAYNACLASTNMAEIDAVGRFALTYQRPSRVILVLSFDLFSADRQGSADFALSGFDGDSMPLVLARTFFSFSSLVDAVRTIKDNLRGLSAAYKGRGFVDNDLLHGTSFDYRQAFEDVLEKKFLVDAETYADYTLDPHRLELLQGLLTRFAAAGTAVHLAIAPLHARQLEAAQALGLYADYERWLREVARIVGAVNQGGLPGRTALWDFSGYNSITTEDVPERGEHRPMRWYWESSHFSDATGELMLARMLGTHGPPPPADFGVRLDSANVEAALAARRVARAAYMATQPGEIADVLRLVAKTEPVRARVRARSRGASLG